MINRDEVFLTKEGREELEKEFLVLKEKKLPKLIQRVAKARSFGDLSENAEYSSAREDLAFIEGRIGEIEEILSRAQTIRKIKTGKKGRKVSLGAKVTLKIKGKKVAYTVVGEWEADPVEKKISQDSPLGKALMGKKEGEKIEVEAPAGKIIYTVHKIH